MRELVFKSNFLFFSAILLVSTVFAQESEVSDNENVRLVEMRTGDEFANAQLKLTSPDKGNSNLSAGENAFEFEVKNYQLGAQTPDVDQQMCANSSKGQHIHFILDNAPYVASYSPIIKSNLSIGHHVLLAFLSRSYHESIKSKKAFVLTEFNVGELAKDTFDEKSPHLFFSRPKGEYVDPKETNRVMLDFYLVNCDLSPNGYKVKATIDGKEFLIDKWAPYFIEGLKLGQRKVKLELIDKNGNSVKSPFNPVERSFYLTADMSPAIIEEMK